MGWRWGERGGRGGSRTLCTVSKPLCSSVRTRAAKCETSSTGVSTELRTQWQYTGCTLMELVGPACRSQKQVSKGRGELVLSRIKASLAHPQLPNRVLPVQKHFSVKR